VVTSCVLFNFQRKMRFLTVFLCLAILGSSLGSPITTESSSSDSPVDLLDEKTYDVPLANYKNFMECIKDSTNCENEEISEVVDALEQWGKTDYTDEEEIRLWKVIETKFNSTFEDYSKYENFRAAMVTFWVNSILNSEENAEFKAGLDKFLSNITNSNNDSAYMYKFMFEYEDSVIKDSKDEVSEEEVSVKKRSEDEVSEDEDSKSAGWYSSLNGYTFANGFLFKWIIW